MIENIAVDVVDRRKRVLAAENGNRFQKLRKADVGLMHGMGEFRKLVRLVVGKGVEDGCIDAGVQIGLGS